MKQSQLILLGDLGFPRVFGALLLQALAAVSVAQTTPTLKTGHGNTTETDPAGTSVGLVVTEVPNSCTGTLTQQSGPTGTCSESCNYPSGPATVNKGTPAPPSGVGTTSAFLGIQTYQLQITGTVNSGGGYTFTCPISNLNPALAQSQAIFTPLNVVGTYTFTATAPAGQTNTVTVNSAINPSTTAISVTPNPVTAFKAITLTASVSGSYDGGTVTFYDGSTALGTAALNTSNVATITTSAVTKLGTHSLTAQFSGDSWALSSTSSPVNLLVKLNVATLIPALAILLN
jgi:hypothetical protein